MPENKTITNASVTAPPKQVREDPNNPYPNVVARPLVSPDFINLKAVNPALELRWGNAKSGDGMRLDQLIAAGFRYAKPEEVYLPVEGRKEPCPPSLARDGKIVYGDVVCLIISKALYQGALKYNWDRAIQRMHPQANRSTGQKVLQDTLKESGVRQTPELTRKLSAFQPSDKDFSEIETGGKSI